ncbi:MAG: response regulator transcription factor [Actinomycetaceae bacterium]|nr:response regulator transcription factor [Actinomycetaceae bacterium]
MIRIAIADDQAMVRGALAALLALEDDIEIAGTVGTGTQAVDLVKTDPQIDVVLMDVEMPDMDGLAACEKIRQIRPRTRVLMVSTFGRPGYVRRAFNAGASGFVVKDAPSDELANYVRDAARGRQVIDPQLAVESLTIGHNPLTEREIEVLREVENGGSIDDIANALFLSAGTVRNHVSSILGKTGARNRADAATTARHNGWL